MIKAPYNFVPLENRAFYPGWANHISQDIPFEDGVSGSIDYTITAETPIFVRNGYTDRNHPDEHFSRTSDGRYFIPGTSIKGEIRNVLEILSFGKMTQVQDARFGIREVGDNVYAQKLANEHCGWLYKDNNNYYIRDCGTPGRIETATLNGMNGFMRNPQVDLNQFKTACGLERNKTFRPSEIENISKSALLKYITYGYSLSRLLSIDFLNERLLNFSFTRTEIANRNKHDRRILYRIDDQQAQRTGTIIFTGQPSPTKKYDFVFFEQVKTNPLCVSDEIIKDFKSIHKENIDFQYIWEQRLENNLEIPVFFTLDGNNVNAIGLSGMFRIPSANFIKGAIPAALQSRQRKDLAECIFGTADNALGALKGRVVISPAYANGEVTVCDRVTTVLGSPKPSYGPLYVSSGSWNDPNAVIKGRKRYPVRNTPLPSINGAENISCSFIPLQKGTSFTGRITFHNLRECELGAIISALTFNGNEGCFHSIGEAKPLGYGKVKIQIGSVKANHIVQDATPSEGDAVRYYLRKFGEEMKKGISDTWADAPSIRELIAMSKGIKNNAHYDYMVMNTGTNEFKGNTENLPLFTEIERGKKPLNINSQSPTRRKSQKDIDDQITEDDNLASSCIRLDSYMSTERYEEAQRLIDELKDSTNLDIRTRCEEYQSRLNDINKAKHENDFNDIQNKLSEIELSFNQDGAGYSEEQKNAIKSSISELKDKLSALLSLVPENANEISRLIDSCEPLINRINNAGKGIRPYLTQFKGSPAAYAFRIDKYKRNSNCDLTNDDINIIIDSLTQIYVTISNRERTRGSWTIENIRKTFTPYLGNVGIETLLQKLQ